MLNHEHAPDTEDQRSLLQAKIRQVSAQAYEAALNAAMMEVQLPLCASKPEKEEMERQIATSKRHSTQLYAAVGVAKRALAGLPTKPELVREEEGEPTVEVVLPEGA